MEESHNFRWDFAVHETWEFYIKGLNFILVRRAIQRVDTNPMNVTLVYTHTSTKTRTENIEDALYKNII